MLQLRCCAVQRSPKTGTPAYQAVRRQRETETPETYLEGERVCASLGYQARTSCKQAKKNRESAGLKVARRVGAEASQTPRGVPHLRDSLLFRLLHGLELHQGPAETITPLLGVRVIASR